MLKALLLAGGVPRGRVVTRSAEVRERTTLRSLRQLGAILPQTSEAPYLKALERGAGAVAAGRAHSVDEVIAL